MKIGNVEKVIRTTYLLELGVDFEESDLEVISSNGYGTLKGLSKDYKSNKLSHLGKWVFAAHYDETTKTVLVKIEKELFT